MALKPWLAVPEDHPFSIENLPFGIFSTAADPTPRPGVAIGDFIVDLAALVKTEAFSMYCTCQFPYSTLQKSTLNDFAALGQETVNAIRMFVKYLLVTNTPILQNNKELRGQVVVDTLGENVGVQMHLPFETRDFTDFLNSRVHAKNTHSTSATPINMFNPPRAFCGRVSSIVLSGTPIVRPMGHFVDANGKAFVSPSKELDVEIELGFFVGVGTQRFERIKIEDADEHIFGAVMLNDWSTRDIQQHEDHPFAAFNAKSFATTISPWVVLIDALAPFKVMPKPQVPDEIPAYLSDPDPKGTYDVSIQMSWSLGSEKETFCNSTSNLQNAYWTFKQMLVHHAFGGCEMRRGDLIGTGTITGEDEGSICSLIEMTRDGKVPIKTPAGNTRLYLEDGDEVVFTAWAGESGKRPGGEVGFGECRGLILPVRPL